MLKWCSLSNNSRYIKLLVMSNCIQTKSIKIHYFHKNTTVTWYLNKAFLERWYETFIIQKHILIAGLCPKFKILFKHFKAGFLITVIHLSYKNVCCVHYSIKFILRETNKYNTACGAAEFSHTTETCSRRKLTFFLLNMQISLYAHLLCAYTENNFMLQSFLAQYVLFSWSQHHLSPAPLPP